MEQIDIRRHLYIKKKQAKSVEFETQTYLCFIDLAQACNKLRQRLKTNIKRHKYTTKNNIINPRTEYQKLYKNKSNNELTEKIQIPSGMRQGESLNPLMIFS